MYNCILFVFQFVLDFECTLERILSFTTDVVLVVKYFLGKYFHFYLHIEYVYYHLC